MIAGILFSIIIIALLVAYCCFLNEKNDRLTQENYFLNKWSSSELHKKTKETFRFLDTSKMDKPTIDKYVQQIQDDGFVYYPKGNNYSTLAFKKTETVTTTEDND